MKNNIFDYATKELSQDAILCYILKNFYSDNENEQKIAESFIKKFIFEDEKIEIKSINNIMKQNRKYGNIDISLEIELKNNDKYLILIEDKTETFLHFKTIIEYKDNKNSKKVVNQIEREIDGALTDIEKEEYNIIYILFKTKENYSMLYFYNFDEFISKYSNNKRNITIKIKDSKNFLQALNKEKTTDPIIEMIVDYYERNKNTTNTLLDKINHGSVCILDSNLKKITNTNSIHFFRPSGNHKGSYRSEINIKKSILDLLKPTKNNQKYIDLIKSSHLVFDIEWTDKIQINIKLNICEEKDFEYCSCKRLLNMNESKYRFKINLRKELIQIINDKLPILNKNFRKLPVKNNSLKIMQYIKECPENSENEALVEEITQSINKLYTEFIKILNMN